MIRKNKKFSNYFFSNVGKVSQLIDQVTLNTLVKHLVKVKKDKGRVFFLGVGGSAGNCSHAVNDFRKLCNLESYTPIDNVSELTARINDEGWDNSFKDWLIASNFNKFDVLFIFSVGGGNRKKKISTNLIKAIDLAIKKKSKIFGIVGRKDGYLAKKGNCVVVIPNIEKDLLTPLTEAYQAVVWHFLVSHPDLQENKTKW